MPGPGRYWIGEEERREVADVLDSGYVFRYGDLKDPKFKHKVYTLEEEYAKYCGAKHALATNSGTSALVVSALAMGLKPGDEVIVPAYTFVASYTALIFVGVVPVLAEIDESLTLDPKDIERRITPRTKGIMPVHMLGNPSDMDAIMALAKKHGLMVLEDACQSAGGSYHGRKLGTIGRMGAYSLNVFKTITCGDGGLVRYRRRRTVREGVRIPRPGAQAEPQRRRGRPPRHPGPGFPHRPNSTARWPWPNCGRSTRSFPLCGPRRRSSSR